MTKTQTIMDKKQIFWWRTCFGDQEAESFRKAIANENISEGALTRQLEEKIAQSLEVPYAVMTTSGSTALLLGIMALDIGPGDEVILPNRTWIATAHAVLMAGASVRLVDVRSDVPVMDVSRIEEKINSKTKAILPVHLNGRAVDMQKVQAIADKHGLHVIEDAAQSLYSKNSGTYLGTESNVACFSMGISKLISTGQGGFVVTKDKKTYEKIKSIKNHGITDIFTDTWGQRGFNFKFTDLLSSVGLAQMRVVEGRINHLKELYKRYSEGIKGLPFLKIVPVNLAGGEFPIYVEALCPSRDRFKAFLASRGVQIRPVPPNISISNYLNNEGEFPHSEVFSQQGLYLPCGPGQSFENVDVVVNTLHEFKDY